MTKNDWVVAAVFGVSFGATFAVTLLLWFNG